VKENVADKDVHGTAQRGERGPRAKLKRDDIRLILDRLAAGGTAVSITADYGIGSAAVSAIKHGRTWKDAVNEYEQARFEAMFEKDGLTFTPSVWRKPVIVELHGEYARAA